MMTNEPLTDINKIVKDTLYLGCNRLDAHSWIELDDGTIIDYDDKILATTSAFGNLNIVRVPFPLNIQVQILPFVKKFIDAFNNKTMFCSTQQLEQITENIMSCAGKCVLRTYIMKKLYTAQGIKCKVVYGSLGFKQPNNKYWYEYG